MDYEVAYQCLLGLLHLLAVVVGLTALLRPKRRKQDYLMGVGALLASFSGVFVAYEIVGSGSISSEYLLVAALGTLGLGMILFAMGFLFDQLQTRRILSESMGREGQQ